jgi:hypothetical protein
MPDAYLYELTHIAEPGQASAPPPVEVEPEPVATSLQEAVEPLGQFNPLGQTALESINTSISSSGDANFANDIRQAEPDLPPVPV